MLQSAIGAWAPQHQSAEGTGTTNKDAGSASLFASTHRGCATYSKRSHFGSKPVGTGTVKVLPAMAALLLPQVAGLARQSVWSGSDSFDSCTYFVSSTQHGA